MTTPWSVSNRALLALPAKFRVEQDDFRDDVLGELLKLVVALRWPIFAPVHL